jgi:carboxyl-terminal processing protease
VYTFRIMNRLRMHRAPHFGLLILLCFVLPLPAWSQGLSKTDRQLAQGMLRNAAADVRKNYYDPKFHGVDWDAKVAEARANIEKVDSMDAAVSEIAALLDTLNDSHTRFLVPARTNTHDYGFTIKMIGEHCYVVRVRPDSDAGKKGLKAGDEVLTVNDHPVSRTTLWRIWYIYNALRPQPGLRLSLRGEGASQRQLDVLAKIQTSSVVKYSLHQGINQIRRDIVDDNAWVEPRYFERGDGLLVVKLPEFALSAIHVDLVLGKMRKHKGVVLDLRDNPGGWVTTVDRLLGGMFESDRKICDRVTRAGTKPVSISGRHHDAYTGRLVVLVDSGSASASEVFARVAQLEKRAFVVGDRTSGMVMEARSFDHEMAVDWLGAYGVSVTDADLVMTDGKSLEHVGVEPDILVLPTADDIANKRDPALAKAAGLVGEKLSPEEAGAVLPDKDPPVH